MRTTVRIDDDLMLELKERAHHEGISLAQLFNKTVRVGLETLKTGETTRKKRFRQRTHDMGIPLVDLTKANQLAGALEDERIIRELLRNR